MTHDAVDAILGQWQHVRPELDVSPMAVVGRIGRANSLLSRSIADVFTRHGLTTGEFDALATLIRAGEPHRMSVGELQRHAMVTAGAMTHRLDRLEAKGYVTRRDAPDSRRVIHVQLTPEGKSRAQEALGDHVENEHRLLAALSPEQADELAGLLRTLLVSLGDEVPAP